MKLNGLGGSGGVNESKLDHMLETLSTIRESIELTNKKDINVKTNISDIMKFDEAISKVREDVKNTSRTNAELYNTKAIQKNIEKNKGIIDGLYKDVISNGKNMTEKQTKSFIESFKILESYEKRFGTDLTSKYSKVINSIFESASNEEFNIPHVKGSVDYEDINNAFKEAVASAEKNLKSVLFDANYEAGEKIINQRISALKAEKKQVIENNNEYLRAEREKTDAIRTRRDEIIQGLKDSLKSELNEIGDDKYYNIDESQIVQFQELVSKILEMMNEWGVDIEDINNLFDNLSSKIYVPKERIEAARNALNQTADAAQNVSDRISEINRSSDSVDASEVENLKEQLTEAQERIEILKNQIHDLEHELSESIGWDSWSYHCDMVDRLRDDIAGLSKQVEQLMADNSKLRGENQELQAINEKNKLLEKEVQETENLSSANSELANSEKEISDKTEESANGIDNAINAAFNTESIEKFISLLESIEKHLNDLKTTLGTIDETKGAKNLISTFDTLLSKLDTIRGKIGTGTYNVEINQEGTYGSGTDKILDKTLSDLKNRYDKVVDAFGGENELYSSFIHDSDRLQNLYSRTSVNEVQDVKLQIDRIREFFKEFRRLRKSIEDEVEGSRAALKNFIKNNDEIENKSITKIKDKVEAYYADRKNPEPSLAEREAYSRYMGIKERSSLLSKINKITAPAKNNARLNASISKMQEAEAEEAKRIQELGKTDLSGVIESLTHIEKLLESISNKKFFDNDSVDNFITKLDNIINKFDGIISKIQIIDNTPIDPNKSSNNTDDDGLLIEPNWDDPETDQYFKKTEDNIDKLVSREEKLKQVAAETAKEIANGYGVTGKSVKKLEDEIIKLFNAINLGKDIDLDNIVDILSNTEAIKRMYSDDTWNNIRSHVSKSKIRISSGDISEFGDDWKNVRATIGNGVFSSSEGSDALVFIQELTEQYGNLFGEVNNTQDAIKALYTYLSKRPNISELFKGDFKNQGMDSVIKSIIKDNYKTIPTTAESLKAKGGIIHKLTGEEISQEAYEILARLKNGADVTVEELRKIPEVVEGFRRLKIITNEFKEKYAKLGISAESTIDLHTEEREALRKYILSIRNASGSFSGLDEHGKEVYNGDVLKEKKAVIVTGLPASGKSTSLVNPLSQLYGAKVLDSDIIKELLPEFNEGWGASLVHRESSMLNKQLLDEVLKSGENVILPIVGDTVDSVEGYIERLKKAGYSIELAANEIPNNETSFRNLLRFFSQGRFLEPGFVREYGNKPIEAFDKVKENKNVDAYYRFNNNVDKGERPIYVGGSRDNRVLREAISDREAGRNRVSEVSRIKEESEQVERLNKLLERRYELLNVKVITNDADFVDTIAELSQVESEIEEILSDKDIVSRVVGNNLQNTLIGKASELVNGNNNTEVKDKKELTEANNQLAESSKNVVSESNNESSAIKKDGDEASKAAKKINEAEDAVERYIRRQRGSAASGNYNYTQAINKVVDKDVSIRTDATTGKVSQDETMRVNYDKLSKELLKTDTEIFKIQEQIKNTTKGNTDGLKKNLTILENTKQTYEDLLDLMVASSNYEVDSSQIDILNRQRDLNKEWLQNKQSTKDSINRYKLNEEKVSLGFGIDIKNKELDDFVERLKELGIYTSNATKEANRLYGVLAKVSSSKDLSNFSKEFDLFKLNSSSDVKDSQKNINSLIREQGTAYKNIWNIRKQISKLDANKDTELISELKTQEKEQTNIYLAKIKELKAINQQIGREQVLYNLINIRKNAENEINSIKASKKDDGVLQRYNNYISKLKEMKKLQTEMQGLISSGVSSNDPVVTSRQNNISSIQQEISSISKLGFTKEQLVAIDKAYAEAQQVEADANAKRAARGILEQQQIDKTRLSLKQQAAQLVSNGKLMQVYGDKVNAFIKELENTGIAKDRLEEIRIELTKIKTDANISGNTGKTFSQILKQRFTSLGAYLGTFASFYRIAAGIRQSFSTITELDTQLVDLRKTTKMNTEELNEFYYSANQVAKQMGVTTSEIISQAAAWSRLGYNTKEVTKTMAELSSKFTSISPGMTTDNATDYLVSTMQAFKIEADDVERTILDNVNAVGKFIAQTYGNIRNYY